MMSFKQDSQTLGRELMFSSEKIKFLNDKIDRILMEKFVSSGVYRDILNVVETRMTFENDQSTVWLIDAKRLNGLRSMIQSLDHGDGMIHALDNYVLAHETFDPDDSNDFPRLSNDLETIFINAELVLDNESIALARSLLYDIMYDALATIDVFFNDDTLIITIKINERQAIVKFKAIKKELTLIDEFYHEKLTDYHSWDQIKSFLLI